MGKVIWTNHLYERIKQRGLNPSWVDSAVRFPDEVQRSTTTDSHKHIKTINGYQVVAAVKRQGNDWIITSAWWKNLDHTPSQTQYKRPLLERLIRRFVFYLGGLIFGKK